MTLHRSSLLPPLSLSTHAGKFHTMDEHQADTQLQSTDCERIAETASSRSHILSMVKAVHTGCSIDSTLAICPIVSLHSTAALEPKGATQIV